MGWDGVYTRNLILPPHAHIHTQAARAFEAYMAFLESNPGVALPSSSSSSAVPPAPPSVIEGAEPSDPTTTDETAATEETATEPPSSSSSVCPAGQTPLVLYLDSGSTGEYEACTAATNGSAAFYFVARAGDSEAQTFALPQV